VATAVETQATFNAFTTDYILPGLHDQVFRDTAVLTELNRHIKPFKGKAYKAKVQVGKVTNHWYDPDADIWADLDFTTPEIGAEVSYGLKYSYETIRLPAHEVDQQGAAQNVDMLVSYTKNAVSSLKESLNTALFAVTGHAATQVASLWDIANDHNADYGCATIGGITANGTTYGYWRAHIMEGEDTYATAVSPSLANIEYMIERIRRTTGEKPDLVIVDEAYYHILKAQLIPVQMEAEGKNRIRDYGLDSFTVSGVPVTWEDNMPSSDWTSGQTKRDDAGGSEALFINWDAVFGIKNAKWNFNFHPDGWQLTNTKIPNYINSLYLAMNLACTSRRHLGHIFNVDLSQDVADYRRGTITLPVAS